MVQAKGIYWISLIDVAFYMLPIIILNETESIFINDVSFNFQLGANAILAVSLAVCKAGASVKKIPLYKVL